MKRSQIGLGLLVGLLLTVPMAAIMYLGYKWLNLPFLPFDLFDWVGRVLPGPVVTFGIDAMINTMRFLGLSVAANAKTAERVMALLQFLGGGLAFGVFAVFLVERMGKKFSSLAWLVVSALFGFPLIGISMVISQSQLNPLVRISWLVLLFLAWGWLFCRIVVAPVEKPAMAEGDGKGMKFKRLSRREFLISTGYASAAITVLGVGLTALLGGEGEIATTAHEVDESGGKIFPNSDDPVMAPPGTRPEYTPVKDHYQVFIRTEPSVIPAEGYVLPIMGMVDNPLFLTLDDIKNNYPARDQYVTLSCISGRIGTTLISTTQWTGASMQDILADAQVKQGARYLHITSDDGYYETVDLDLIASDERIMLCYGWDGNTLPVGHGFPLRIWIPDRYGMKQPKWITGIEVTDEYIEGYWVERNWDEVAQTKATSVIDTVAVNSVFSDGGQQYVPMGGIAFAGARQISKVEVRVDGGDWQEAKLRTPLSETTWVIWRYDWPFEAGQHLFEVRCAEGDGTPQIEETQDARPSGATGIHKVEEDIK
jgi:DMSO/TMAO reductase YedYZ molybdopterin-dependent catalytic subunit